MDSKDRLPRHLLIGFSLALLLYIGAFSCDQTVRLRKGPWIVNFTTNAQGFAMLVVSEPHLKITNAQIVFTGEHVTNTGTVIFDRPEKPLPFGKTVFEDLTYLPGSVVINFFGHEVELLPRTLYLNKKEVAWQNGRVYELRPGEKLPPGSTTVKRRRSFFDRR